MLFILCSAALSPNEFPQRLDDEILSDYDEDVSSIRDGYTVRGLSDPGLLLMRHVVTAGNAKPVYRGAHDRKLHSLKLEYRFDNNVPNRLQEQTRLSILSWNQGPRRGREGAIEEHIAGKLARDCSSRSD